MNRFETYDGDLDSGLKFNALAVRRPIGLAFLCSFHLHKLNLPRLAFMKAIVAV